MAEECAILNCGGAYLHRAFLVACGVMIRNHDHEFIFYFLRRLGHCSVLEVELWAIILHGLNVAFDADEAKGRIG